MRHDRRFTRAPFASINITPFVDVTLVLLVIFMIVTPLVHRDGVSLPRTSHPFRAPEPAVSIAVHTGGIVALDGVVMRNDELPEAIRRLHAERPARAVVVRADRRLSYGEVLEVLGLVRKVGFVDVTLAVEKG